MTVVDASVVGECGQTALGPATDSLTDLAALPALRWDHQPLLPRVLELRDNLTAYDAIYVALAELLQAALVTSDERLSQGPLLGCSVEVLHG